MNVKPRVKQGASWYHSATPIWHILIVAAWMFFCPSATGHQSADPATQSATDLGTIRHERHSQAYLAQREQYFIEILTLALDKSGVSYTLEAVHTEPHSDYRGYQYLIENRYDLQWLNTTSFYEDRLLPIRIPLFKGMIGWRILIIRSEDRESFARVRTLDTLTQQVALQGFSWPDALVLRKNGFEVGTATDIFSLRHMLAQGHGDFLPRGITEVWAELDTYADYDFSVDQHLILRYPAAYYFFVRKDRPELAEAIFKGLNRALADGSFDEIFWRWFRDDIEKARPQERLVFNLANPFLPVDTPLNDKRLWFEPEQTVPLAESPIPPPETTAPQLDN